MRRSTNATRAHSRASWLRAVLSFSFFMRWMRIRLARVAAGWLVFQCCLLVSVPTALCAMSAGAVGAECTCEHGDGQMCPMHHVQSKSKTGSSSHSCSCRSTSDPVTAMAASLIGPPAVVALAASSIAPLVPAGSSPRFASNPLDSTFVPDSPPPRA